MSIIIKGMKMPKEGNYEARLNVNRDGTALLFLYGECGGHEAKELPPHGRLIDADAYDESLFETVMECRKWRGGKMAENDEEGTLRAEQAEVSFLEAKLRAKKMPTIIEAEEEEE